MKYPSNIKEQKRIVEKLDNAFQKNRVFRK
ncbi:hypothetical protein [Brachyspira hyodysenteriae]